MEESFWASNKIWLLNDCSVKSSITALLASSRLETYVLIWSQTFSIISCKSLKKKLDWHECYSFNNCRILMSPYSLFLTFSNMIATSFARPALFSAFCPMSGILLAMTTADAHTHNFSALIFIPVMRASSSDNVSGNFWSCSHSKRPT